MDIIQIIVGRYLLELIGAFVRYIYINTSSLMGLKEYTTFGNIWSPTKKKDENSETNHGVGAIIFILFITLLVIFMT